MKKFIFGGVILIIVVACLFIFRNDESTIITLDINPSIELKLTKNERIKEVRALNEDAKKIIVDDLKGMTLDGAFKIIGEQLVKYDFVQPDNEVDIILYSSGVVSSNTVKEELWTALDNLRVPSNIIVIDNITEKDSKLAKEKGITEGKAAYLNSLIKDKDISVDSLLDKSIEELEEVKLVGLYCDTGYTLNDKYCLKEIGRENPVDGRVCPENYIDSNGTCYRSGNFIEVDEDTCYDGFVLSEGKCVRTSTYKAEGICESGEYNSNEDACRTLIYAGDAYEFCRDPGRTLYDHKCLATKPTINGGCLNGDMLYKGKCVNTRNDYYAAEWKCKDGRVISNADGSLLYEDHKCYNEGKVKPTSYKCHDDYILDGKTCVLTETHPVEKVRKCETGYIIDRYGNCINLKDKKPFVDGNVCEKPNTKLINDECVIYDITPAKEY